MAINRVAQDLMGTQSFVDAEAVTRKRCVRTELDHERRKAETLAQKPYQTPTDDEIRTRITAHQTRARERGATLVSLRRLGEVVGLRTYEPAIIRTAIGNRGIHSVPLCRL
ncbi:hypothetical protein GCM10010172_17570 [Paractinoplanes ferrugineus]|uniref:Uncharacterized protein n=1 Tax=Paractinoplanes ferrugineus TaxID=113564 RepID=A0A919J8F4_9ACTN|nr:hypothetical protein Afe05nite_67930 [Actinoplanes ferrugineus]